MLFVSHDRHFLAALSNRVLELTPDGMHAYGGGYTEYVERTGAGGSGLAELTGRGSPDSGSHRSGKQGNRTIGLVSGRRSSPVPPAARRRTQLHPHRPYGRAPLPGGEEPKLEKLRHFGSGSSPPGQGRERSARRAGEGVM